MFSRLKEHFLKFDWIVFSSVLLLSLFGLAEIYSVALGKESFSLDNFNNQILYIALGIISVFLLSFIDYNAIKSFSNYFYVFGVFILVLVLFVGKTARGTTGWFEVFGFSIQPVEFAKIILIIFLARFFSNTSLRGRPFKIFSISFLGSFFLIFLVLLQPDFGPSAIMAAFWFLMFVLAGNLKWKHILIIIIPFIAVASLSWTFYLKDYQKSRILVFLNPAEDSLGEGYNVSQALIAVGSGGLTGRGIGFGSQSQLKFLPEAQNDFIFSVISEELGFLGSSLLLLLFFILFSRLLFLVKRMKDDFSVFLILGGLVLIFIQMFINIGMNIGIMPVVGISLPFVSYGGSATIASFVLIGLIQSVIIGSKN
ncbi:MAG: rod shape-determining protein RodA [Patescibacteria group bacterium]